MSSAGRDISVRGLLSLHAALVAGRPGNASCRHTCRHTHEPIAAAPLASKRSAALRGAPRAGRDLVNMAKKRPNVIPIIEDARHPQKYRMLVPMVDVVFADVAQPDQARIVGLNAQYFLRNGGFFVISIKASCIDSTAPPEAVFAREVRAGAAPRPAPRATKSSSVPGRSRATDTGSTTGLLSMHLIFLVWLRRKGHTSKACGSRRHIGSCLLMRAA